MSDFVGKWENCKDYWIFLAEQRTEDWLKVKIGRPSGSTLGGCLNESNFDTPDQSALYLSGKVKKEFTEKQLVAMAFGTEMEPIATQWYERTRSVKVKELGLAIPKWNLQVGVSVDGVVEDSEGIIEIKCPKKMYWKLKNYDQSQEKPDNYNHIFTSHYLQMQLGMAVLKKKWCDYIVYCQPENSVFVQRVDFNQEEWDNKWYPKLEIFIENKLNPLLEGTPYPLMPPIN